MSFVNRIKYGITKFKSMTKIKINTVIQATTEKYDEREIKKMEQKVIKTEIKEKEFSRNFFYERISLPFVLLIALPYTISGLNEREIDDKNPSTPTMLICVIAENCQLHQQHLQDDH